MTVEQCDNAIPSRLLNISYSNKILNHDRCVKRPGISNIFNINTQTRNLVHYAIRAKGMSDNENCKFAEWVLCRMLHMPCSVTQ